EVVEILRDGSRFRNEGAVVELEHGNDARRILGQERRLLVVGRDEIDRHPFDLGFEPLRGDDGTYTDRVWEALTIIDFHSNLLHSGIYYRAGGTTPGQDLVAAGRTVCLHFLLYHRQLRRNLGTPLWRLGRRSDDRASSTRLGRAR